MTYTSRHDLPWWSDPDYDELGRRIKVLEDEGDRIDREYERWRDRQEQDDESIRTT